MKYTLLLILSTLTNSFAEEVGKQVSPFANAPWCKLPCVKIHLIVWGTILGTIGLQIILLYLLPRMPKLKKWQKYTVYGILTVASLATAAYILPPYLQDGFVIGRCFIGDPMGCQ
jgi:hypothetical protein